jgi:hypothetical protein
MNISSVIRHLTTHEWNANALRYSVCTLKIDDISFIYILKKKKMMMSESLM